MTRIFSWTQHQLNKASEVKSVIDDLEDYLPLTLRQIFYRLVAAFKISNTRSQYNMLSTLVSEMRHEGMIDWDAIADQHRRVSEKRGWTDQVEYVQVWTKNFCGNYERCLVQDQPVYIEMWVEKDALSTIFERVAYPYCIRVVTNKGFSSTTFVNDFRNRVNAAITRHRQRPIMLYFGDFDPSGVAMLEDIQNRCETRFDLHGMVEHKRIALNIEDIQRYNLPYSIDAIKKSDTRYKQFCSRYGDIAVELDALHPAELEKIARKAIESELDMDLFNEQREIEQMELQKVAAIREKVQAVVKQELRVV